MPEELTSAQEAELGRSLEALEVTLAADLARSADSARPVELDSAIGRVTRVDALQQQAMVVANRRNVEQRLALVRHAKRAFEDGTYGYCRRCEEPVGYRRLKLRPETPLCVICQAGSERR